MNSATAAALVRVFDPKGATIRNYATGWPWYYLGPHEDPALKGKRPDLKGTVRVPEVLFQAHSSALSVALYDRAAFPAEYRGDAFVALHGSHSQPDRTGYQVIRVRMKAGRPTASTNRRYFGPNTSTAIRPALTAQGQPA